MSDVQENLDDVFEEGADLTEEVESEEETKEVEEESSSDLPRGYMTKEAWVASGKDPEDWVSPEGFKLRGEHIKQTQALKRDFDNQIKNLSLFHQIQLKNQREELLSKRDDAIDVADKAAVKAFDKQLKDLDDLEKLNAPEAAEANTKAPQILEWEKANPWCFDPKDPRTALANKVFKALTAAGDSYEEALNGVNDAVKAKFSSKQTNVRQIAEGSRTAGGKRDDTAVLTMKNLTSEERKYWETGMFASEKDFLKAAANARKGEKQ
jgi:hypothetical protein